MKIIHVNSFFILFCDIGNYVIYKVYFYIINTLFKVKIHILWYIVTVKSNDSLWYKILVLSPTPNAYMNIQVVQIN